VVFGKVSLTYNRAPHVPETSLINYLLPLALLIKVADQEDQSEPVRAGRGVFDMGQIWLAKPSRATLVCLIS
jgi:hypothetical protein